MEVRRRLIAPNPTRTTCGRAGPGPPTSYNLSSLSEQPIHLQDGPIEATFAFIDLAGFSALTEVHGDLRASGLIDRFRDLAYECAGPQGRLLKMIGDEAFLIFDDPRAAVIAVEWLITSCLDEPGFPLPQAGLHHGNAIARSGEVVGTAVNVASRLADAASAREVYCTADVADAAAALPRPTIEIGPRQFHNISQAFDVYSIQLGPVPVGESVDPVCRMAVRHTAAAARLSDERGEVWFCSLECADRFERQN